MRRLVTAAEVEDAARNGQRQLDLAAGALLTPLARDRAAALGITLDGDGAGATVRTRDGSGTGLNEVDVQQLALESRVRIVTRRVLLRGGRGLADCEAIVSAVLRALEREAGPSGTCRGTCGGTRCGRGAPS